ncbi:MAG: regulatory protein GemA [Deltaproteobacteria bacterium]|jgi:hypothetical protein|nr:regulatory protein GemA [Deltaproteobacteria bacterium]
MAIVTRFPKKEAAPAPGIPPVPAEPPYRLEARAPRISSRAGQAEGSLRPRLTRKRASSCREEQRKMLLAKIHIARKDLEKKLEGWSEDVYRFALGDKFGTDSAKDLSNGQLHETLLWLSSLGWQARPGRQRRAAPRALEFDEANLGREALLSKIEAQLAEKGRVEGTDVPWGYAVAILKRQSGGVSRSLDQAEESQLRGVLMALWKDARRKGRYAG